MKYNLRKLINYKNILFILLFTIILFLFYNHYNGFLTEGFIDTPEGRSNENRFKIESMKDVVPTSALYDLQEIIQSSQDPVVEYLNSKDYAPVNNDADVKNAISILYNDINLFPSTIAKFYFIAATVPIFFESFVYDKDKLSVQYNALLQCYPKTIQNGNDYRALYTIIILAEIANDIINSELNPMPGKVDGTQVNYYGYITDPIMVEIKEQLEYFYKKL